MRFLAVLLALCAASATLAFAADDEAVAAAAMIPAPRTVTGIVKSVSIEGGNSAVKLGTRVGERLDPDRLSKDVKALWSTGEFQDIRVHTSEETDGEIAVVFRVVAKSRWFLHDLRLEPNSFGMQPSLTPGTPIDDLRAQQVAGQIRRKLVERGYKDASVEPEIKPLSDKKADLLMHVTAGHSVKVETVEIVGDTVFPPKEVQKALQALRSRRMLPGVPGIWNGWTWYASYSEEAVQSDMARLQSFYLARGYFDARVAVDDVAIAGDSAKVKVFVTAGRHYDVNKIDVAGNGVESTSIVPRNGLFVSRDLCSCLMHARRQAELKGIVDFTARINMHAVNAAEGKEPGKVDLNASIDQGKPYTVGRIEFQGLKHYSEATVRRNFLIDETDLLDQTKLRKSLARLNQSNLFDPIDETQVAINTDEATGEANIVVPLHERKRGMWNFSGPVGPIAFAGPLQFMLASRLPPWGRGVLEMSTWYLSFSLLGYASPIAKVVPFTWTKAGILPVISLFRPFTPGEGWKSGFLIAPQLGWQGSLVTYGTTQLSSRLVPLITGDSKFVSQLAVTFERPVGDGVLLCDPPKPRLHTARAVAAMVLQFVAAAPSMM